jgi:hypothetical protein
VTRLLATVLVGWATVGCVVDGGAPATGAVDAEYTSEAGLVSVHVAANDLRVGGGNELRVTVPPTATAVRLVAASAFMPAHGHGTDATVVASDDGAYHADNIVFFMPGRWELRLAFSDGTREDRIRFYIDVP